MLKHFQKHVRQQISKTALASLLLFFAHSSFAADEIYTTFFSSTAINGYDPVAYFTNGAAYKGKSDHQYEWKGAKWRFYTEENMNLFIEDPEKYAPQYGGHCAFAAAEGIAAGSDPQQFTIVDDKLYFNYNNKTKIMWTENRDEFINLANEKWPEVIED